MKKLVVILLAALSISLCQCKQKDSGNTTTPLTKADTIQGLINSNVTTLIVLRHAEKELTGTDPNLDSNGLVRAQELKNLLSKVTINNIYSTSYNRTRQTAQPLAADKGLTVIEYPTTTPYATLVTDIRTANKGKVAVIVGHSNTVPDILRAITNNALNVSITEAQYDNLYICTIPESLNATVTQLKYGRSTP